MVEESKDSVKKQRKESADGAAPDGEEESKSEQSFSSYDEFVSKGKFKCRACLMSFKGKKLLEKHRKTAEHKAREKKYS